MSTKMKMEAKMSPMRVGAATIVLCLALVGAAHAARKDVHDASGFVVLSDVAPDIIQEIRYATTYNFVGDRIDGYDAPSAILTKEAALALSKASDEAMSRGYRLKVWDAYRPQRAVSHFVAWAKDTSDERMKPFFYPGEDKAFLFARGYIASRSGHSRGSTVDLTLFDMRTGKEVDLGGTFDLFDERSWPSASEGLTPEQREARETLRDIMTHNGFVPLSTEWWHFTLKDEPWPKTYFDFPVDPAYVRGQATR